jgi:hypothetical protein
VAKLLKSKLFQLKNVVWLSTVPLTPKKIFIIIREHFLAHRVILLHICQINLLKIRDKLLIFNSFLSTQKVYPIDLQQINFTSKYFGLKRTLQTEIIESLINNAGFPGNRKCTSQCSR